MSNKMTKNCQFIAHLLDLIGLQVQYLLGPKIAVPMRTSVAPYLTATGQSSLMPMLNSLKYSLSSNGPSFNVR